MKYLTKEIKIGITGIIALCLFVYGINYLKGVHLFRPTAYFYVKFKNVGGLTKSSPVFADGFPVGIVRNIAYDYQHPGNVTVEVGLNAAMRMPYGSSAELVAEMLGGARMNLLLPLESSTASYHAIGDTIPGRFNNGLSESVSAFIPKVEQMVPKLDSILTALNGILNSPDVPATIHSLRNTAESLETTGAQLTNIMNKDVPKLVGKLNRIGDNFVVISDNLKGINYAATFREIDATIANVKALTEQLNNKNGSLHLLLNDAQLYNNLNTTFVNASGLLDDLKQNPKRYVHFSLFGKKQK